jgi:hypothetical protein
MSLALNESSGRYLVCESAMILIRHDSAFILILTAMLLIACTGRGARAQDDVVADDNEEAPVNMVFNVGGADQVDQMLYGRFGGAGVARNQLDSALALRIDDVTRICGVTEAQKKKLQLAGRGDIKRFFDRVEETKRKFQTTQNNQFNNIWQEIQPLQTELSSGLFGEDSLFAKTVKRTLSEEQAIKFENVVRQRSLARYQSTVAWCVVQLDKSVGLSDNQRRRLVELLVKETKPPRRFGQNDYWFMMLQASKLPESKLKPILDDVQWRFLQRQLMQGRGMEQWLKMSGVIDDDKPAGARPAVAAIPAMPLAPAVIIKRAVPQKKAAEKKKD